MSDPTSTPAVSAGNLVRDVLGEQAFMAVDCGSANGVQQHWLPLVQDAHFMLFEPHPESYAALKDWVASQAQPQNWRLLNVGLSESGGRQILYAHNAPTGSSLLPPDLAGGAIVPGDPNIFPVRQIPVETQSLAAACDQHQVARVDLFKIDAQGAELSIIRGLGEQRLATLLALETEVICRPMYVGQSTLSAVHDFMTQHGLELFDLRPWPVRWIAGGTNVRAQAAELGVYDHSASVSHQLHEVDVLYFRSARRVLDSGDADTARRLLVCYCTYGFFGQALWFLGEARERGLFEGAQADALGTAIRDWHDGLHRAVWQGRGSFWNFVRRVYARLRRMLTPATWSNYGTG